MVMMIDLLWAGRPLRPGTSTIVGGTGRGI